MRTWQGVLVLAVAATTMTVQAETYRWVDRDGTVHYGQVPPKGAETGVVPPAPPPSSAPNQEALNSTLKASVDGRPEQQEQAAQQAKAAADRKKACAEAQQGLAFLSTVTANRLRTTQEQYDQRKRDLEKAAKDHCS